MFCESYLTTDSLVFFSLIFFLKVLNESWMNSKSVDIKHLPFLFHLLYSLGYKKSLAPDYSMTTFGGRLNPWDFYICSSPTSSVSLSNTALGIKWLGEGGVHRELFQLLLRGWWSEALRKPSGFPMHCWAVLSAVLPGAFLCVTTTSVAYAKKKEKTFFTHITDLMYSNPIELVPPVHWRVLHYLKDTSAHQHFT